VVAVGETGLDWYRDRSPRDAQVESFAAHLEIAAERELPVVIHMRESADDTFAMLRGFDGTVVLHCFSALDHLGEAVERGWYCSFAGNVTFPKATDLQEAARAVPDELLLVETDAPFLGPQPVRGKPNEPANVVLTARFVAEQRGIAYEELDALVEANAARVFGW
jgi:TatD DNase family protein